jgi:molybdate transport system substrate-binding protein
VKTAFEAANPGATVITNFAASGALLRQIESGAPVDVFAAADQKTMDQAAAKNLLAPGSRADFVQNGLVLIQPVDAKLALKGLADLTQPGIKRIAIGNPETVPAGRYAKEALTNAKLWESLSAKLVPSESVRQTLDYVARGEAEAGFVFSTDAKIAGSKVRVVCDAPATTRIAYPIAVVAGSGNPKAKAFVDFVLSPAGQKILQGYGFKKP